MFRHSGQSASIRRIACSSRELKRAVRCLAAASAVCIFAVGTAEALDCVAIIVDRGDQFSFGQARLGDPPSRLPSNATRSRDCGKTCEYSDDTGASYVVEGQEIIKKEIRDVSRYQGALPARISATDSLPVVLMKLGSFTEGTPIWSLTPMRDGSLLLATDNCIEGGNGVRGAYGFVFDRQGRLSSISARAP
jgi:hypothetical protein